MWSVMGRGGSLWYQCDGVTSFNIGFQVIKRPVVASLVCLNAE